MTKAVMCLNFWVAIFIEIAVCSSLHLNPNRDQMMDRIGIDPPLGYSSFTAKKDADLLKRALRSDSDLKSYKIDEERVGIPGLSKLDDVAYKLALKMDIDPTDMFKRSRFLGAGGKREDTSKLIQWLQYAEKYRVKRGEDSWYSDKKIYDLVSKTRSEKELVTLFQSLRQVPDTKNLADKMQAYMILSSASSHRLVNEAWLKSRETPQQVFKILRLKTETLDSNPLFIQWLRYIKLYRALAGRDSFSDAQILNFLVQEKFSTIEAKFGTLFQSIKDIPDLEHLAKSLQTQLYNRWIEMEISPGKLESLLEVPNGINFLRLQTSDPMYRNLKAYTKHFVEHKGDMELLKTVEKLFLDNDPQAAIVAASKA